MRRRVKTPRASALVAALVLLWGSAAAFAQGAVLESVRVGIDGQRTRVVLDLSAAADFRIAERGAQVIVELAATAAGSDLSLAGLRGGALRSASRSEIVGGGQRVNLELRIAEADVRHFVLRPDPATGKGHRLVIDVYPGAETTAGTPAPAPAALPEATAAAPAVAVEESAAADSEEVATTATTPQQAAADVAAGSDAAVSGIADAGSASVLTTAPVAAAGGDSDAPPAADEFDDLLGLGGGTGGAPQLSGYFEPSAAYTYADPTHWSKLRARLELAVSGGLGDGVRYKLAARLDGDGAYVVEDDFYDGAVRDDQRFEAQIREFYLDFGGGAWAHRVGRQHIVWGEMVGLFLADVVSARDTREFVLQEFEAMRIPQWAWNTQYFAGDSTLEFVYIPVPSVDKIGEPGADFYPFPVPPGTPVRDDRPDRDLSTYNWGVRGSTLWRGWSLAGYYYDSISVAPSLVAEAGGLALRYEPIEQIGGTFSKDFGGFVFKGEAVYASDRPFQSFDPTQPGLLLRSDALDWVVGTTVPLGDLRVDLQLYGRRSFDYDPRMGFDEDEFGATVLLNYAINSRLELELLALAGLNREDYLVRPKIAWRFASDWRLQMGADIFGGSEIGLFGPYESRDRVYIELKRWF